MATFFPVATGIGRAEIPALCADLAALLRGRAPGMVTCRLAGPGRPGVATVEALLRLRLTARRYGWQLRLHDPTPDLVALLTVLGLADTLTDALTDDET
ncbi:STAS domain-containing protein [Actinoplanes sp. NPDC023714]|uniref:STAS domain-containing protein n=1 Tax=Actinoplanes sp. NPDC023714 TaxID=3154322 RepID=UPI0033E82706